jgi:hypothetical protein
LSTLWLTLTTLKNSIGNNKEAIDNLKAANMNKLNHGKQARIIAALVEGSSQRGLRNAGQD